MTPQPSKNPTITLLAHARVPSPDSAETYDRDWATGYDLAEALATTWPTDVHATQYAPLEVPDDTGGDPIVVRASKQALAEGRTLSMVALFGDLDDPVAHRDHTSARDEWRAEVEAKLEASGLTWYRTRGGARVVLALPDAVEIRNEADERAWWDLYLAFVAWAKATHGLELDPRCKDCWHLFRLPNVMRDGKAQRAEVQGAIGVADLGAICSFATSVATKPEPSTPHAQTTNPRMQRALTMASRLPPSVEGCGGDAALYHAATELGTVLGDDAGAIREALDHFNARCLPPWPSTKLDLEARRAAERHDPVMAAYASRHESRKTAPQGAPVDVSGDPIDRWHMFGGAASFVTPEEPIEYLCEGLQLAKSEGKISIIAGQPGGSKGPTADHLAVCFALGAPAFGKHPCKATKVMVIDYEGRRLTMRRLRRLARGMGRDPADLEGRITVLDGNQFDLRDRATREMLGQLCRSEGIEVLILDSYTTAMVNAGVDANSPEYAALASALGKLDMFVLAVAHCNKASAKNGVPRLSDIAFTGALGALAQTALGVYYPDEANKNQARVACLRAPEGDFAPIDVQWSGDAKQDDPLTVKVVAAAAMTGTSKTSKELEARKAEIADASELARRILRLLAGDRFNSGWTAGKLRERLSRSGKDLAKADEWLARRGYIETHTLPSESFAKIRITDAGRAFIGCENVADAPRVGQLPQRGDVVPPQKRIKA